ncbi:MAG: YihY/virulence factor BrkB family protein [Bradyrhizobiaceae bacterium]|nr:YihY/virulence factor BrkB family protein [Bradyrhizobiaceae bacterium]
MQKAWRIAIGAFDRLNENEGWAIASHIALSALMALFPFLIFVTAVAAALLGSRELADETARILLEAWPEPVAAPIAAEIRNVMRGLRGDVLTFAVALALYFSSSGIESLRIGLNRAYGVRDRRPWWLLRLESIGYVIIGAAALLALSFLVVLYPLMWASAIQYVQWLARLGYFLDLVRIVAAAVVLVGALLVAHWWLPAGRRTFSQIWPGILVTLALWLAAGIVFGRYLANFAYAYVTYYAGLASVMAALVFLYLVAMIFIYGAEVNAAITRSRKAAVQQQT